MQKIEFRKVRDFGELINATFEFIRQNYKITGKALLFIAGPAVLASGIAGGFYQADIYRLKPSGFFHFIGLPYVVYLASVMIASLLISLISYQIMILYNTREPGAFTVEDVWQGVKHNFFMFLFTFIGSAVLLIPAFILLVFPGIYLVITLSSIYMIRMIEGAGYFEGLTRSAKIISGNWWFTFALILILYVIQLFFSFFFQIPQFIVSFIVAFNNLEGETRNVNKFILIITSTISSFSYFFQVIVFTGIGFHYFNLVEQKEAAGLIEKIESI